MAASLEDAPPPPYSEDPTDTSGPSNPQSSDRATSHSIIPNDAKRTVRKADGLHIVALRWHIVKDPRSLDSLLGHREMYLEEDGSKTNSYTVKFKTRATSAPDMYIHRGDERGIVVGQVSFAENWPRIEIGFPDGEKIKIGDTISGTRKISANLLVEGVQQIFHWVSTDAYEHEHKGKSQVGDVELLDENGTVLAVFLNEWKASGNEDKKKVGQLNLLQQGVESGLVEKWIVIFLALVERHIIFANSKAVKVAVGTATAAVALCVVS